MRIVGNGSWKTKGIYRSFLPFLSPNSVVVRVEGPRLKRVCHFPNPFACLPISVDKASLLTILIAVVNYAVKMTLQTSLGTMGVETYNLTYLQSGLTYLPSGIGNGVGSLGTVGYGLSLMARTVCFSANGGVWTCDVADWHQQISVMLIMQFLTGATTASTFVVSTSIHHSITGDETRIEIDKCTAMRYASDRPQHTLVREGPGCVQSRQMPRCGGRYCGHGGIGPFCWAKLVLYRLCHPPNDVCALGLGLAPTGHAMTPDNQAATTRLFRAGFRIRY